jgi:hypothetical protein
MPASIRNISCMNYIMNTHILIHTHTYIYIYIYICICMCMCVCIHAYRDGAIAGPGAAVPKADGKGVHRPQSENILTSQHWASVVSVNRGGNSA